MTDFSQPRHWPRAPILAAWLVLARGVLAPLVAGQPPYQGPPAEERAQSIAIVSNAFFYKALPGSDMYVGPIDILLNKGFNFSQVENRTRRIFEAPYGTAHVRNSVLHPFRSIDASGGWGAFFREQILPIQTVTWMRNGFEGHFSKHAAWYPNYFGHLIEGGISSRRLAEKLRAQGVPGATALAGTTTLAAAVINEMYTHPGLTQGTGGTVADLYLFDLGGVLLFSLDPVARFFAETLHASVWPSQASISLPDLELTNNANNLVFKFPLPFVDAASLFFLTGITVHVGASVHMADGYDVSIGLGASPNHQNIDPVTGREWVSVKMSSSIYLDRGGSVLASLNWSQVGDRLVSINVYPGVVHAALGAWFVVGRGGVLEFGLTHRNALGLGLGVGLER